MPRKNILRIYQYFPEKALIFRTNKTITAKKYRRYGGHDRSAKQQ